MTHIKSYPPVLISRAVSVIKLIFYTIYSRPVEGKSWEYRFFVDFEGNLADAAVKNAIRGLREEALNLKILGNY